MLSQQAILFFWYYCGFLFLKWHILYIRIYRIFHSHFCLRISISDNEKMRLKSHFFYYVQEIFFPFPTANVRSKNEIWCIIWLYSNLVSHKLNYSTLVLSAVFNLRIKPIDLSRINDWNATCCQKHLGLKW